MGSEQVAFAEALRFAVEHLGVDPQQVLLAGSPAWCALDDDDPAKTNALIVAGLHWALHLDLGQSARAEASKAVAASENWSRIGRPRPASYIERRIA